MKFTRDGIVEFISKGRTYITCRTGIDRNNVKDYFYSERNLTEQLNTETQKFDEQTIY